MASSKRIPSFFRVMAASAAGVAKLSAIAVMCDGPRKTNGVFIDALKLRFCFRFWATLTDSWLCPSQQPLNVAAMAHDHIDGTCNHEQPICQWLLQAAYERDCCH